MTAPEFCKQPDVPQIQYGFCDVIRDHQLESQLSVWGCGQSAWSCLWYCMCLVSSFEKSDGLLSGVAFNIIQ